MKRLEEFQSPNGQAAWFYYQLWMRQMRRMPPPPASFLSSKYFRTFVNFAKHVKGVGLPKPDKFIWLMQQKDLQPTIWTSDEVYSMWLEHLDRNTTPLDQAKTSIETLFDIANKKEIDVAEVFDSMQTTEIIHYLRTRQLSPWLLLLSKKFKVMFRDRTSPEQKIILETMMRADHWHERFQKHPKEVESIKKYVGELGI